MFITFLRLKTNLHLNQSSSLPTCIFCEEKGPIVVWTSTIEGFPIFSLEGISASRKLNRLQK